MQRLHNSQENGLGMIGEVFHNVFGHPEMGREEIFHLFLQGRKLEEAEVVDQ